MANDEEVKSYPYVDKYPYGYDFQLMLLALVYREPKFIDYFEHVIQPKYFDTDEFRHLARIAVFYFTKYGRTPDLKVSYDVVRTYCMDNKFTESVRVRLEETLDDVYRIEVPDGDWIKDQAIKFAQAQLMKEAIIEGSKLIHNPDNYPQILINIEKALNVAAPRKDGILFRDVALDLQQHLKEHSIFSNDRRVPTGLPSFDAHTFGGPAPRKLAVMMAPSGTGKLIADDTPVLTTQGWVRHGDLVVGDEVFSYDGKPVKVVAVGKPSPANVKVEFKDGSSIYCHENHEWVFHKSGHEKLSVVETNELIGGELLSGGKSRYMLPNIEPLEFPEQDLPLHPYALGLWLGDGIHTKPCICHSEKDSEPIQKIVGFGYEISNVIVHKKTGVHYSYFGGEFDSESHIGRASKFRNGLTKAFVLGNKHIPRQYQKSSISKRLELLAGLIDSDGHVTRGGTRVQITSASELLTENIVELVRSFGWRVSVTYTKPTVSTSGIRGQKVVAKINFTPSMGIPTVIPRKMVVGSSNKKPRNGVSRVSMEPGRIGRCIQVDREDGIYLVGKELIPTHNSHWLTFVGSNAIRQGHHVFHYTFGDMDEWEVLSRYAANFTKMNSKDLFFGRADGYQQAMSTFLKSMKNHLYVSTHPADTITPAALKSHISLQSAKLGIKPAVIIIDYADNLATGFKTNFEASVQSAQLGNVYQQLIKIAHEFESVVWTGSQVGRGSWDKVDDGVIDKSAVAASVKKIEHADYILTLNQSREEHENGIARIYEAKIRFGEDKNIINVRFNKNTSTFIEDDRPPLPIVKKSGGKSTNATAKKGSTEEIQLSEEDANDPNRSAISNFLKKKAIV